jgi:hypothetical protein
LAYPPGYYFLFLLYLRVLLYLSLSFYFSFSFFFRGTLPFAFCSTAFYTDFLFLFSFFYDFTDFDFSGCFSGENSDYVSLIRLKNIIKLKTQE